MSLSVLFLRSKKEEIAKASQPTLHPAEGVKCIHRLARFFRRTRGGSSKVHARLRKKKEKVADSRAYTVYRGEEFLPAACSRGSVVRRERQDEDDLRPFNEMRSRGSLRIRRRIDKNLRGFVTCRV